METEDGGLLTKSDHMTGARVILLAVVLSALTAFLAMILDTALRSTNQDTAARMIAKSLDIPTLAIWPPGHPLNQPLAVHPGVDLRLAPNLPRTPPGIY